MNRFCTIILLCCCNTAFCQEIKGIVANPVNGHPIEFANIGIVGKNIGTVSSSNGKFSIILNSQLNHDSLLFSAIGYEPHMVKIADLRNNCNNKIFLKEKAYNISEVRIIPRVFTQILLGVTEHNNKVIAGFKHNLFGYECGIRINVKKNGLFKTGSD